ncbi:MAG: hypothetical protein SFX72_14045 [Isosphaeraceae bacterium]|nr:hypothetical protein [Isosphaeraceae bacterium]
MTARSLPTGMSLCFALLRIGAETGFFAEMHQPSIGAIVAATIVFPTVRDFRSSRVRQLIEAVGCKRRTIMLTWRVPAAILSFPHGCRRQLLESSGSWPALVISLRTRMRAT